MALAESQHHAVPRGHEQNAKMEDHEKLRKKCSSCLVVDVHVVPVVFHARCCRQVPKWIQILQKFVEDSAVAVPPVVDVAVLCITSCLATVKSATDSVHRRSQWTSSVATETG